MRVERIETFVLYPDEVQEFRKKVSKKHCIIEVPDTRTGMRLFSVVYFSKRPHPFSKGTFKVKTIEEAEKIKRILSEAGANFQIDGLRFLVFDYGALRNGDGLEFALWYWKP